MERFTCLKRRLSLQSRRTPERIPVGFDRPPTLPVSSPAKAERAVNLIAEDDFVIAEVRGDVLTKRGEHYDNEYHEHVAQRLKCDFFVERV